MKAKSSATLLYDLLTLLAIISFFITVSFIFIYSSSSVFALEKHSSADYFVKKQLIGLLIGLAGFLFIQCLPFKFLQKASGLFFYATLCLTLWLLIPHLSISIHGARRWLFWRGLSFQPSELLKVWLLVYVSAILSNPYKSATSTLINIMISASLSGVALLLQPDFGTMCVLLGAVLLIYFIARCPWKYIISGMIIAIPMLLALIVYYPYRVKRILTFLDPWQDPQGAGFQIIQSLIAIGSGGMSGLGISHSKQKFFYLPMQHTDFIFSIIAEETGFIGTCTIIMLYAALLYIGMRIAYRLQDPFAQLCTLSFTILVSLQALINFAVSAGLVPTKGIGLPFISYGNSSLIAYMLFAGIVTRVVRYELYTSRNNGHIRFNKPLADFA